MAWLHLDRDGQRRPGRDIDCVDRFRRPAQTARGEAVSATARRITASIQPLGGLAPEPLDVAVVGLVAGAEAGALDGNDRPLVEPALDFGVTVGEGKTTGPVVVAGRQVGNDRLREIGGGLHFGTEEVSLPRLGEFDQPVMITVLGSPNQAGKIAKFRDAFLARQGVKITKFYQTQLTWPYGQKNVSKYLKKGKLLLFVDPLNP